MSQALLELALFASKSLVLVLFILIVVIAFFALLAKSKDKTSGRLTIKNLNEKFSETKETLLSEILPKTLFKAFLKEKKSIEKNKAKSETKQKNLFILNFMGDIKASAVSTLREEITAILTIAEPNDEVLLKLESGGGVVHGYGLAAAQLMRLRDRSIPLTVAVDKIAASGGYMMACVGNKVLSAPFAIIGSIGVIVQLPNFHRVLKNKQIDFEQHTAGEFKRTITMFGENTDAGREKLQEEIEDIHGQFKHLIAKFRTSLDMSQVATGEHWLGNQALDLGLVDEIQTSDEFVLNSTQHFNVYELAFEVKKPLLARLSGAASQARDELMRMMGMTGGT